MTNTDQKAAIRERMAFPVKSVCSDGEMGHHLPGAS